MQQHSNGLMTIDEKLQHFLVCSIRNPVQSRFFIIRRYSCLLSDTGSSRDLTLARDLSLAHAIDPRLAGNLP